MGIYSKLSHSFILNILYIIIMSFFGTSATAIASCPVPELPPSFKAEGVFFTIGTDFNLKAQNGKPSGKIEERVLHLGKTFEYFDSRGQKVATGRKRIFSWGSTMDVYDCNDRLIGTVKEDILKSLFKVSTQYKILDATGKEVATSEKVELLGTKFTMRNGKGETVATMERPFINWFTDTWNVQIGKNDGVDPRILMMIPAFKTAADKERESDDDDTDSRSSRRKTAMNFENFNSHINGKNSALNPSGLDDSLVRQASLTEKTSIGHSSDVAQPAAADIASIDAAI